MTAPRLLNPAERPEPKSATSVVKLDTSPVIAARILDSTADTVAVLLLMAVVATAVVPRPAIPAVDTATWLVTALKDRNAITVRNINFSSHKFVKQLLIFVL